MPLPPMARSDVVAQMETELPAPKFAVQTGTQAFGVSSDHSRAPRLGEGARVQIHGLKTASGKRLEGAVGTITEFIGGTGMYKVVLDETELDYNIRPSHLNLLGSSVQVSTLGIGRTVAFSPLPSTSDATMRRPNPRLAARRSSKHELRAPSTAQAN
jgi:hypothetical protein